MAFNFGSTGSTFGNPPSKPTAFGSPINFGPPATTAASAGFGFGSTFGAQPAQPQPAFGSTFGQPAAASMAPTFGQPTAASMAPTFGSTFGQPASAAPAFGTSFGAPTTAAASAFGNTSFGAPATAAPAFGSTFGAPATSTPAFGSTFGAAPPTSAPAFGSTFGAAPITSSTLFGSSFAAPATASNLFGATAPKPGTTPSLFGTTTTAQVPSLFGTTTTNSTGTGLFGNPVSAPPLFGSTFNNPATSAAPSLFGAGAGGFGLGTSTAPNTGFGLFGAGAATTSTAPSLFSGFGKTTTAPSGFTGFGNTAPGFTGFGNTGTTNLFGATSLMGQKPPILSMGMTPQTLDQQLFASIYGVNVFGDERDIILKKWNMLQACWGVGKGYYNASQPPIEYDNSNPFFRYKAIGYALIPEEDSTRGLVKMIISRKESELTNQKDALSNGLLGILGNKPNLTVHITHIKSMGDSKSGVIFYVEEKGITGSSRRVPSIELSAFLNQGIQKQQLANVGVTFLGAYVTPSRTQLEEYLRNPPPGIEIQHWQAAQMNNPNPRKFQPVVVKSFTDLKKSMLLQQYQSNLYRDYLNGVTKELHELNKKHSTSTSRISELKQKHAELQHRVLKIIIIQESTRKLGMALQPEEEMLKGRLEQVLNQLSLPSQYKAQLYELTAKMSVDKNLIAQPTQRYEVDEKVQQDIKQFLKMEQKGIAQLMQIVNNDMRSLKIISEGLRKMNNK